MSKLNVDQKNVKEMFEKRSVDYLIPDYQRPYAWGEKECQTLWDDIFLFAFPDNDKDKFDSMNDEYFLGPVVTFKNDDGKMEIIDGQQRLTTLMLLLRAFYSKFGHMQDEDSKSIRELIEKCIWKTNEFGKPDKANLKIDSEVATDKDKDEFLSILRTGEVNKDMKSSYANNYIYFVNKIAELLDKFPGFFMYMPNRILNNCIMLPIEAESQDTALRIFSTLNDRGKPLSDADIFKAQFYKYYSKLGQKDVFMDKWKKLEALCEEIFHPSIGTAMDEIFTRYMYYERAKMGNKSSTTEALRKFYEKNSYELLKNDYVFNNLIDLANFWNDIENQSTDRFSDRVLRKLFVLNYAPNGMWTYFLSVYYMSYKNENGELDDDALYEFLNKSIAFIWTYAITNPGVNALRTPVYAEMVNVVNHQEVDFGEFKFDEQSVRNAINNYSFTNGRPVTKSMITWWAYNRDDQSLMDLETKLEIEHIFAKNRETNEKILVNKKNLESLGNKALLEKKINIRAADYRFTDKKKYYLGFTNDKGKYKEGTKVVELVDLTNKDDFAEKDIESRYIEMINKFIDYLKANDLIEQ